MTDEEADARLTTAEWHAELCRRHGAVTQDQYDALNEHLTECVKSDYFGVPRPVADDEWLKLWEAYMDRLYADETWRFFNKLDGGMDPKR